MLQTDTALSCIQDFGVTKMYAGGWGLRIAGTRTEFYHAHV